MQVPGLDHEQAHAFLDYHGSAAVFRGDFLKRTGLATYHALIDKDSLQCVNDRLLDEVEGLNRVLLSIMDDTVFWVTGRVREVGEHTYSVPPNYKVMDQVDCHESTRVDRAARFDGFAVRRYGFDSVRPIDLILPMPYLGLSFEPVAEGESAFGMPIVNQLAFIAEVGGS
jgi:hypothetical protein